MGVERGPQNPTPTSTSVRAENRLTRVSQLLHYIPRYRIQLGASVWLTGEVVLGLPTLGVVGFAFGVPCWCAVGGPRPGCRALGKYLDPVKKGSVWPSEPGTLGY